jgi:hypothetical protein
MTDPSQADASAAQTAASAAQQTAATLTTMYEGLIPDLTKVQAGSLTAGTTAPLFADATAYAALHAVTSTIVTEVMAELKGTDPVRLLITGDLQLATSESLARQVRFQLDQVMDSVNALVAKLDEANPAPPAPAPDAEESVRRARMLAAVPVATAIATAIPGILSLFTAQRTVSSAAVTTDDVAVAASLVERFTLDRDADTWTLAYDSVRLLPLAPKSPLQNTIEQLGAQRAKLVVHSQTPNLDKATADAISVAITGIDAFQTAVSTIPSGVTSSALMTAYLREQLDPKTPEAFTHVLVASTRSGAANGSMDHHLLGTDRFSTVGSMTVSYFLLEVEGRNLLKADTVTRTMSGSGKIGEHLTFRLADQDPVDEPSGDDSGGSTSRFGSLQ